MLFSTRRVKMHEEKCDGFLPTQCRKCMKVFSSSHGRYMHMKSTDCVPPPSVHLQNTSVNNSVNNSTINGDVIFNNNNISINVFGKEDYEYLMNNGNVIQQLVSCAKKGIYGFSDIIKEIHCNNETPHNNTIIKPLEYGDGVMIMGDDNEWEYREFEDVRDTMIESVSKFINICDKKRNENNIKLRDMKERLLIKRLGYSLLSIDGDFPEELFEELKMDTNKVDEDDDVVKSHLRKFDKATLVKLFEYTQANFKKNNGKYVKTENNKNI
jgi:hypothetical protein